MNSNVWITSDTHYHHPNICRGITKWSQITEDDILSTFPFLTLEEMNKTIINNINNVVKEDDILYHLGDWSFGGFDKIQEFRNQLRCKNIILILGNHDHHLEHNKENVRKHFLSVCNKTTLIIEDDWCLLIHDPNLLSSITKLTSVILHGHFHSLENNRVNSNKLKNKNPGCKYLDVGIIGHPKFRPYSLKEIKELLKQ